MILEYLQPNPSLLDGLTVVLRALYYAATLGAAGLALFAIGFGHRLDAEEAARLRRTYGDGVRWFDVLSGPDLAQLYRSADVMVFPSETDTFGLVLIESMACGTPVAALPATGPIDVVGTSGEGGVIDTDLKAACLAALRCDRTRVRAFAERYTWAAATRQFEQALRPIPRPAALIAAT